MTLLNRFGHFQCRKISLASYSCVPVVCAVPQIRIKSISIISHLQTESVREREKTIWFHWPTCLFVRFVIIFVSIHTMIKLKILFFHHWFNGCCYELDLTELVPIYIRISKHNLNWIPCIFFRLPFVMWISHSSEWNSSGFLPPSVQQ